MERLVVIFAFILIFAFNSIDNAVAPMVMQLGTTFGVVPEQALLLISVCTGGTVVGLILGPALVNSWHSRRLLLWSLVLMVTSQVAFPLFSNFYAAMVFRAASGLAAGLVASVMWRLTFHGVSKAYFPAMIAVLMSARPLASALGVPAAGLMAGAYSWQLPVWIIAVLTGLSGLLLYVFYPQHESEEAAGNTLPSKSSAKDTDESASSAQPQSWFQAVITPYLSALKVPFAKTYYLGTTINRIAYFGFYSFCGLWFYRHYQMDIKAVSLALFVIGLAECLVNFLSGRIIKTCGHKATFLTCLGLSAVLLPIFIFGGLSLKVAVAAISLFMLLDRIYSMALVISVPQMFPSTGDKTAFGSLNTLTSWGAMTIVSYLQGTFMEQLGIGTMESFLVFSFIVGSLMLIWVQHYTVFTRPALEGQ